LSEDQAKQFLHKARHLLDAMVVAFQQLHNWSLQLNFKGQAVVEQSKLNNDLHNEQADALTKMLGQMSASNKNPFKAIINRAAENFEEIGKMSWQINFMLRKMGKARKITYLTTQVKNALKKLDREADDFNAISQQIYQTSLTYYMASQMLESYSGALPPPPMVCPWQP